MDVANSTYRSSGWASVISSTETGGESGRRSDLQGAGTNSTRAIKQARKLIFLSVMGISVDLKSLFWFSVPFEFLIFCCPALVSWSVESLGGCHRHWDSPHNYCQKKAGCSLVLQNFTSLRHERWSPSSSSYSSISLVWPAFSIRSVDYSLEKMFSRNFNKNTMNICPAVEVA